MRPLRVDPAKSALLPPSEKSPDPSSSAFQHTDLQVNKASGEPQDVLEGSEIRRERSGKSSDQETIPRPTVRGKFIFIGRKKFHLRGVTYGPFAPTPEGCEYHTPERVEKDFAAMHRYGINSVRTYTPPPRWLLDLAQKHGLHVMVGIPWEQHITFLSSAQRVREIEARLSAAVRELAGHPAILCFSVGNEIPASIVRWHGRRRIEKFLSRLYWAVKAEDPAALVTYVNYPSTEYLALPFDLFAFNVYLESPDRMAAYLARLQSLAGDRPLLLAEIGLDSLRNGEGAQANVLEWQIRTVFSEGACGLYIFSWTDEWFRGGQLIEDWKFGLTTLEREPKQALHRIEGSFAKHPVVDLIRYPLVSVVVCSYNGSRTIGECLQGVRDLAYPFYEVIVVDDGSRDQTADLARAFGFQVISVPNGGLSNARNVGWRAAKGEIVAYLDDDACPDRHWLNHMVHTLLQTDFIGAGGPNISPPEDGFVAQCVDHAPGNPTHVLLDDRTAEHVPGCNMAFWRHCLEAVDGFDATFRIAGDDVDFCWRVQQRGWEIGFSPAAVVWHHRRSTVRTYLKQQINYGRAEAMLERKWPEKYNASGHLRWECRVYSKGSVSPFLFGANRVYHGTWGMALFQSVYDTTAFTWSTVVIMPEWYMLLAVLGGAALVSSLYLGGSYLLLAFLVALSASALRACAVAKEQPLGTPSGLLRRAPARRTLIAALHFVQPAARLWGRISYGLTPWRKRNGTKWVWPLARTVNRWSEIWKAPEDYLLSLEKSVKAAGPTVVRGGAFDRWDLETRGGVFAKARTLLTIEEHGQGKQLVRYRVWPVVENWALALAGLLVTITVLILCESGLHQSLFMAVPTLMFLSRVSYEKALAMGALLKSLDGQ